MEERRAQGTGAVQLDRMLDDLPVAVAILDAQGHQVHANRTFWELFTVPASRRARSGLRALLHPEEDLGDDIFDALMSGEAEKVRIFREFVRPDGSGFRGQITAVGLELGAGQPWFLCVVDDVSERVSAAEEMGRLAKVVESTSDLVGVFDLSGRTIYLNHAARDFFSVSDAAATSSTDLYTPEAIVKFATEIRPRIEAGRTWAGELTMIRADGEIVPVLQSIAPDDPGEGALRLSVVGRPAASAEAGVVPRVAHGADELVIGLAAQLAPLQQRVDAAASEIEKNLPGTAGAIREAASVLDRMVGDLDELLDGSDLTPAPPVAADPVAVARAVIDELSLEGVDLSLEIRPHVPWMLPDSATLEQTIRRALDAVANDSDPAVVKLVPGRGPGADTLDIEVAGPRAADIGDLGLLVLRRFVQRQGGSMRAVTDSGQGIVTISLPVEDLESVPLRESAAGVPAAEPRPAIAADPRRGPTVEPIPLEPAAFVEPEAVTPLPDGLDAPADPSHASRSLRVLAVDDNDISQMLVADHLRELGHEPFLADCGATVPDRIIELEPDIVLLAIELPDMDGPDLCRYIRATGWAGPILGITVDVSAACRDRCQAAGMDGLLTKPVEFEILGSLLEQAMDLCVPTGAHFAPPPASVPPPPAVLDDGNDGDEVASLETTLPALGSSSVRQLLDNLAVELGGRDRAVSMVEGYLAEFDGRVARLLSDNRIEAQSAVDSLLSVSAMLGLDDMVEQCLQVNASLAEGVSHPHPDDVRAVAMVSKVALESWLAARPVAVG